MFSFVNFSKKISFFCLFWIVPKQEALMKWGVWRLFWCGDRSKLLPDYDSGCS